MQISIEQVIDIYNKLIDGINSEPINLIVNDIKFQYPISIFEDINLVDKKTAEDVHQVCFIFSSKHQVEIFINEIELNNWILKIRSEELKFKDKLNIKITKNKHKND